MELMRLHRFIAQAGITSRRKAEEMIQQGRVEVNGEIVVELGTKVGPSDIVVVDGQEVKQIQHVTLVMNKPKGYVTTMDDPEGRHTVVDLLPPNMTGVKPVGRLDRDTEGLLLFTTEGDLAMRLTHARYGIDKEYVATVYGIPTEDELDRLRRGIFIEDRRTAPCQIRRTGQDDRRDLTTLSIILHEGRNRQIRNMFEAIGKPVKSLRRTRIGHLVLKGMSPGEVRLLPQKELLRLKKSVGL